MKIIKKYEDLLVFDILILLIEFSLRYCVDFPYFQVKPLIINLLILLIINSVLINLKSKYRRIVESIILTIVTIYSFAQSYHFAYFDTFFSITKITVLKELNGVKNEIFDKMSLKYILFLIPLITWIVYLKLCKKDDLKMNRKEIAIKLVLSILVIAISSFSYNRIFKINENLEAAQKIESEPYLYHNLTNKNRFINRFGTIAYIFKDTKTAFNSKAIELSKEDKEWINNYRKNHSISKNDKTGLFEGKNLILILGESFCNDGIHPELTPTLYKMRQEGFYFDNYYAPIYQSATNDSEFIALTSNVPSIDFGTTSKEFGNNHFPFSLPHLFKNQGYKVNSFHSFIKSFYNREPFHESLGFSYLYDRDDLNIWRDNDFTDYINWSDDKDLFEKTMKKTDSNEHFFDFIISASGHLPYMDLREELYDNYDKSSQLEGIDSESAYYLAAQMKLDQGLERLIEILDEKGILEDTVICVFGDHYPYGISSDESLDYLFGDNTYGFEKYRVPFLIYNSEVKGETSHKLGSTFDIFPTLCNLFGLDASGAFITGNDLFSEQDGLVLFPDSSFITEDYYYDALSSDVVYFGNVVNYQDQLLLNEELFRHSQLMLKSDFFRE